MLVPGACEAKLAAVEIERSVERRDEGLAIEVAVKIEVYLRQYGGRARSAPVLRTDVDQLLRDAHHERGIETVADRRTSVIYDPANGREPLINAAGRQRRSEVAEARNLSIGPEGRTLQDRCLMSGRTGPPMVSGSYNNNMQLVQTKDHIVILSEMIHYARIIRLDSEHSTRQLKWAGDSVAHWEGDTLVINTENFYYHTGWRGTSASLKVEERISWADENTLGYDFTVEVPLSWDVSWSGKLPMRRIEDPIYEYACHEGNHGLPGILAGWRRYESMGMNGDGTAKAED